MSLDTMNNSDNHDTAIELSPITRRALVGGAVAAALGSITTVLMGRQDRVYLRPSGTTFDQLKDLYKITKEPGKILFPGGSMEVLGDRAAEIVVQEKNIIISNGEEKVMLDKKELEEKNLGNRRADLRTSLGLK